MDNRVKMMIRRSSLETIANYFDAIIVYHLRKTKTKYVCIDNIDYVTYNDYVQICKSIIRDTVLDDTLINLLLPGNAVFESCCDNPIRLCGVTYKQIELLMLNPSFKHIELVVRYNERKHCIIRFNNEHLTSCAYVIPIKEDRKYSSSAEAKMKLIEKWLAD